MIIRYIRDLGYRDRKLWEHMHAMDIKEKKILNQEVLTILCDDGVHISEILQ